MKKPTDARLVDVEDAIARLDDLGCPCGVPRSDLQRLESLARWVLRRHDSAQRRGTASSLASRRTDLLAGLLDVGQPHGGLGPKADAECLADAALAALGYEGVEGPRH